jgi:hypothetical protein
LSKVGQRQAGELHQALERGEALAGLGREVALHADLADQHFQRPASLPIVLSLRDDLGVEAIDIAGDALEHVGGAIDDGFEQAEKRRRHADAAASRLAGTRKEVLDGAEFVVAVTMRSPAMTTGGARIG